MPGSGINPCHRRACVAVRAGHLLRLSSPGRARAASRATPRNGIAISQTDLTSRFAPARSSTRWSPACRSRTRASTSTPATCSAMPTAAPSRLPFHEHRPIRTRLDRADQLRSLTGRTEGSLDNQAVYVFDTLEVQRAVAAEPRRALRAQRRRQRSGTSSRTRRRQRQPEPRQHQHRRRRRRAPVSRTRTTCSPTAPAWSSSRPRTARSTCRTPTARRRRRPRSTAPARLPDRTGTATATSTRKPRSTTNSAPSGTCSKARLALTAAVFRNDRENYKVADPGNPANPTASSSSTARRAWTASPSARPATSPTTGRSSPTSPTSTAKCCRACPTIASHDPRPTCVNTAPTRTR